MSDIDFTEDNNPDLLLYLDEQNVIPDYVRSGNMITKAACADLSEKAFADPTHRLYPCHTKAACWLSAAHFAGKGNGDATIKENILKQAKFHEIEEDVNAVFDLLEPKQEKKAAAEPQEKYALSVDWEGLGGRGVEHYYPIDNSINVMLSSERAAGDYDSGRLPLPYLRKAARAIVEAARELTGDTLTLDPTIIKYGSVRTPDPYAASIILSGSRKSAGVDVSAYTNIMDALASELEKCAAFDTMMALADAAAQQVYHLDKEAGIEYGSIYQDPYTILYCGPTPEDIEKVAAAHVDIRGVKVPTADFINLSDNKIDQTFRKEAAEVIKQAKETVKGTPTAEKTASASTLIRNLNEDAQKVLLCTLAETCF